MKTKYRSEIHERKKLRELIDRCFASSPEDASESEYFWEENFKILSIALENIMKYLDNIDSEDIFYIKSIFDDLSEYFKSKELIKCMERNAKRTGVDCSVDIEYAKMYLSG